MGRDSPSLCPALFGGRDDPGRVLPRANPVGSGHRSFARFPIRLVALKSRVLEVDIGKAG